jgi:hypothetical protein
MKKSPFGVFEITLPPKDGQPAIPHNTKVKVGQGTALKNVQVGSS